MANNNDLTMDDVEQVRRCVSECHVGGSCDCPDEAPFRFVVGPDKTVFFIHASRITRALSPALHGLVHTHMREGLEQSADLPEDDPAAVEEFRHQACTGEYSTGETLAESDLTKYTLFDKEFHGLDVAFCRSCKSSLALQGASQQSFPFCTDACRDATTDPDPNVSTSVGSSHFCAGCQAQLGDRGKYHDQMDALCGSCESRQMQRMFFKNNLQGAAASGAVPQTSNLAIDLMHHLCVWVFADKYLADDLAAMALTRLHKELRTLTTIGNSMGQVLELIEFVYENVPAPSDSGGRPEKLTMRYLLSEFVGHHKHELASDVDFLQMMFANDELADDTQ